MKLRTVLNEREVLDLLDAWEPTGLPLVDFCRQRGIDGRSLRCWRLNLARRRVERPKTALRLVEITRSMPARRATYRIRVGELVIEVDEAFDEEMLARLLGVAATC